VSCSVEDRKRWIQDIQSAHAAVAPAAAAASIALSLSKQNATFAALDAGSKARLHAMFIDFVAKAKTAPRQQPPTSTNVATMDACCFNPSDSNTTSQSRAVFESQLSGRHFRCPADSHSGARSS
jgi:hypothetical protein